MQQREHRLLCRRRAPRERPARYFRGSPPARGVNNTCASSYSSACSLDRKQRKRSSAEAFPVLCGTWKDPLMGFGVPQHMCDATRDSLSCTLSTARATTEIPSTLYSDAQPCDVTRRLPTVRTIGRFAIFPCPCKDCSAVVRVPKAMRLAAEMHLGRRRCNF